MRSVLGCRLKGLDGAKRDRALTDRIFCIFSFYKSLAARGVFSGGDMGSFGVVENLF